MVWLFWLVWGKVHAFDGAVACDLLRAGRNSVAAVAGLCGWNGEAAFRKAFASRFGVPPLRWARGKAGAVP